MFNLKVYTMKRQRFFEGLGLKVYVTLAICMALLLNVQFLNAQSSTINVKGVVNDAMGPVIGASVVEKAEMNLIDARIIHPQGINQSYANQTKFLCTLMDKKALNYH